MLPVPVAHEIIRPAANRTNWLRGDEARDTHERLVDTVDLGDEFSDCVEGVAGAEEDDAVGEGGRARYSSPKGRLPIFRPLF